MARVIGPTPPGLGLTQPATSATSSRDVSGDLGPSRHDPADADVEDRGAGLDHVGGDQAGHTGRGDDDVGLAHLGGEVAGAGVAQRRRWRSRCVRVSMSPSGRPTVMPRPTTTTWAPAIGTS